MANSAETLRVATIQSKCTSDRSDNRRRAFEQIASAAANGARLIVLQELFDSVYFCQTEDHRFFEWAEPVPGPLTDQLAEIASRHGIVIVAGIFERRASGVYHNAAVVLDSDRGLVGHYRKMHVPEDPGYSEKFYFSPGDLGSGAFQTSVGKIGVCICWDQWFPEWARLTAMRGCHCLIYPTAIGWLDEDKANFGESQLQAWQIMIRSHAIANGIFAIAANRVGREAQIEFWGSSLVADPYGNLVASASQTQEETLFADLDLNAITTARTHWPFFRDRRIDCYEHLAKRWLS